MGANSSNPTELILYDKELYFHANGNDGAGTELWKYNSTQGAMRVLDLRPGIEGSEIRYPAVYNGALYFQANPNDGTGAELWRYDPLNGAQLVADINMMGDSLPYSLRVYNGALYFGADGGDNAGMELWKYDTLHGAARVADIYPGSGSSVPTELAVVNNALYFAANGNDGAGRELWVYSNTATARYRPTKSYEGWLLESSENSSIGGGINNSAAVLNLGDDSLNRQYRSILSFDTSTLPDNAMVLGVTLKIRRQGLVGTNPFTTHGNILVDIMKGAFSGNLALQASDFQAAPSKVGVGVIRNRPDPNNWFTSNLAKTAFAWVNRKGVTQLRLRFSKDDNNDNSADFLKFYSANSLNYTDYPLLEVKYYIP
jgi:ELWxxDGT repeat protein